MSIKVDFGGVIATINNGKWATNKAGKLSRYKTKDIDGMLAKTLNSFLAGDLAELGGLRDSKVCELPYVSQRCVLAPKNGNGSGHLS